MWYHEILNAFFPAAGKTPAPRPLSDLVSAQIVKIKRSLSNGIRSSTSQLNSTYRMTAS